MWVSHSLTSTIVGVIICTYALFYCGLKGLNRCNFDVSYECRLLSSGCNAL